ncbi:MAG: radical SAM protein [Deferribacterota bacterium]|nr:radical SAM protein [Deferribacterota bacterium]
MLNLVYAAKDGSIIDEPSYYTVATTAEFDFVPPENDYIDIPNTSKIFYIPDSIPLGYNKKRMHIENIKKGNSLSAFLPPGYLRLYLPAYKRKEGSKYLPFYAYCHIAAKGDKLVVPAIKIDDDSKWNPANYDFTPNFVNVVKPVLKKFENNKIVNQLSKCALEYGCTAAKNFFLGQYEAPIPTSNRCNCSCLGCISFSDRHLVVPHNRLTFTPTAKEIVEVALYHGDNEKDTLVSFGQGCEGDPIMVVDVICKAVKEIKAKNKNITINFNSNCSKPEKIKQLIDAGIDSIRVTLFSADNYLYNVYHKPADYSFEDVLKSLDIMSNSDVFLSLNLLVFPGITDRLEEIKALEKLLDNYRIDLIQWRNLNIDKYLLFDNIKLKKDEILGLKNLLKRLKRKYKHLQHGYFNRPKSQFYKELYKLSL